MDACPGVLIESFLSGTPVLGVNGSVSEEMIYDGLTGINVSSLEEAVSRIKELSRLDPQKIRSIGVERYSQEVMTDNYIKFYQRILDGR